jgi:hypothetical protein
MRLAFRRPGVRHGSRPCAAAIAANQGRRTFLRFASLDGASCPSGEQGDVADHSLLLQNGLIRVGITLPASPEFQIAIVSDPYGCAITTDPVTIRPRVSAYCRPLPTANLRFLSAAIIQVVCRRPPRAYRTSISPFHARTSRRGCGCTADTSSTRPTSSATARSDVGTQRCPLRVCVQRAVR